MIAHRGTYNSILDINVPIVKDSYEFNTKNAPLEIIGSMLKGEAITIVGDYDADGVTASGVMFTGLNALKRLLMAPDARMKAYLKEKLGMSDDDIKNIDPNKIAACKIKVRIPKRYSEGYGMKAPMIDEFAPGLIITVDNGISALEAVKAAKEKGFKVIVTDHHAVTRDENGDLILPDADCIINPHIEEALGLPGYDFYDYCGAGVALKLIEEMIGSEHPVMNTLYSYAAMGTTADVMPMLGDNRNIYNAGVNAIINKNTTLGVMALMAASGVSVDDYRALCVSFKTRYASVLKKIFPSMSQQGADEFFKRMALTSLLSNETLGFSVAPRINAPGRIGTPQAPDGDRGAERSLLCLLQNKDPVEARKLAEELSKANEDRKNVSKEMLMKCEACLAKMGMQNDCPIVAYLPDCKSGIIGLVAGDLCQKYGVPVIVFNGHGEACHGSARSPDGANIKALLDECRELLVAYGGHAGAAGITIDEKNIDLLRDKLRNICTREEIKPVVDGNKYYDVEIDAADVPDVAVILSALAPFGEGFPEPTFYIRNFNVREMRVLGSSHIKLTGDSCSAIGFGLADNPDNLKYVQNLKKCDLIGHINFNCFRGNATPQITIDCFPEVECKAIEENER